MADCLKADHAGEQHQANPAGQEAAKREARHAGNQAFQPAVHRPGEGDDADREDRAGEGVAGGGEADKRLERAAGAVARGGDRQGGSGHHQRGDGERNQDRVERDGEDLSIVGRAEATRREAQKDADRDQEADRHRH